MRYLIYYLLIVNVFTFFVYGIDKKLAIKKKERISERSLFFLAFIGGGLGGILGMLSFRHKTRKLKFYIWNMIMITLWGYLVIKFWEV